MSNPNIEPAGAGLVVYPTGTYPIDVTNVQWAVDNVASGGTVLMKSADRQGQPRYFHFGDDTTGRGSVNAQRDVVIFGEAMAPQSFAFPNGRTPDAEFTQNRTVIYGGLRAFRCMKNNALATALTVRHIFFAYPALCAVQVTKSSGLEVSDCVVYDIKKAPTGPGSTLVVSVGIEATTLNQTVPDVRGEARVLNNIVKRAEDADYGKGDTGIGLQLTDLCAEIRGNTVIGFAWIGIGLDGNRADAIIEDNDVVSCGYGQGYSQSSGIGVRRTAPSGSGNPIDVTIRNNRITGGSMAGPGGLQLKSRNGIAIWGSSKVAVSANTVTGAVESDGILITSYAPIDEPPQPSKENVIARNDLKALLAGHAQEFFDSTCGQNQSTANDFGAVNLSGSGVAGIVVHSDDNKLTNETFWGNYPGTNGSPDVPCIWLMSGTKRNRVTAMKRGGGSPAFDLCTQIQSDDRANIIPGYERCAHVELEDMRERERQHSLQMAGR